VGPRRAAELMMTNRVLSAQEAMELGLVTRVVPPERVEAEALALATQLAAGPTEAYGHVKRLLLASAGESLETQMELEARAIADAARTADAREGMAAFFEKREPRFHGR
jgi:2-(1,2-epoxy-1,2-dihydrophenyl)acetyl-CoA isomerase